MAGQALGAASQLAPAVMATQIAEQAGLSPSMIGIYTGLVFLASAISALGGGGLIGKYGAVSAVQAGVGMSAMGCALAAIGHPAALILSAIVIGLGYGPMTPASSVVLSRWSPKHRLGLIMSIKQTGVPIGYAATGLGMPILSDAVGWQTSLFVLAGISALTFTLLAAAASRLDEPGPSVGSSFTAARLSLGLLKRHNRLRRIAFASLAFAGVQVTITSFLVVYLENDIGLTQKLAAFPLFIAGIAAIAGRIGWGYLADIMPTARLLMILPVLMAVTLVALILGDIGWNYILLAALGLALGFSVLAWNGVMLIETARRAPDGQVGLATSGVLALTFLGSTIFPWALSFTVEVFGTYQIGFIGMAIASIAVALWYLPDAIKKT